VHATTAKYEFWFHATTIAIFHLFCLIGSLESPPNIMVTRKLNWSFRDSNVRDWLRKGNVLAPLVRPIIECTYIGNIVYRKYCRHTLMW
jgi:hypothetical protein